MQPIITSITPCELPEIPTDKRRYATIRFQAVSGFMTYRNRIREINIVKEKLKVDIAIPNLNCVGQSLLCECD